MNDRRARAAYRASERARRDRHSKAFAEPQPRANLSVPLVFVPVCFLCGFFGAFGFLFHPAAFMMFVLSQCAQ